MFLNKYIELINYFFKYQIRKMFILTLNGGGDKSLSNNIKVKTVIILNAS